MEPPGGLPPERDRQLVLANNSTALVPVPIANQLAIVPASQQQQHQSVRLPQCIKPTTLSLQPQAATSGTVAAASSVHQQQLSPSAAAAAAAAAGNNNPATSSGSGNANSGTSPALASTATAISATTQAATAFSGSSVGHHHLQHHHPHHPAQQQQSTASTTAPTHHHPQQHPPHHHHHGSVSGTGAALLGSTGSGGGSQQQQQQTIEKLSRPMAFDKMELLVREMQDQEHGVPVRQQKMFLTSIPYAFMGYDLIEWLMDRLQIEESEALNIANQLCLHGYFFPVNDSKTLAVKDDSSLYRFQTPYYWPWQHKAPDNVEYAIYLAKRSLRNKQRHALEDYEAEALASLHKNLKGKWDFISMQAEEQVRLAKERKKGDKIVGDSQERAYWRVHRPPPGQFTPLEPCPVPSRDRQGGLKTNKKKTVDDVQREVDYLSKSLNRTRMKMSQACESLVCYSETFSEYDFFLQPALPSNPWVTEDTAFWQLNNTFVEIPTEKRVKRWAISIEELVSDPTGLQEFTGFLEKEYSHENIRFWIAVNRLRRSAHSQVARKVNEIYEEFLKPGAPCEINIDGKTMESVLRGLKQPSRFTFDSASEHIYMLLLKKDCYPRFIRSEHYKRLLDTGIQPSHKKRFFNFGGVSGAKKKMTAALSSQPNLGASGDGSGKGSSSGAGGSGSGSMMQAPPPGNLARRRGSDRSLTGSAHELAVIGVNKDAAGTKVPHSHSQSNLSEMPYSSDSIYRGDMPQRHAMASVIDAGIYAAYGNRESSLQTHPETVKSKPARLETTAEARTLTASKTATAPSSSAVCPWDEPAVAAPVAPTAPTASQVKLSVCPWEQDNVEAETAASQSSAKAPALPVSAQPQRLASTSSDISDVAERMQRNLGIRHQNTVDSGEAAGMKRLMPNFTEQRRASVSFTPSRSSDYQFGRTSVSTAMTSPTVGTQSQSQSVGGESGGGGPAARSSFIIGSGGGSASGSSSSVITKDPPSGASDADAEFELEELNKLTLSERNSESSASELPAVAVTPTPTPTPPPITKITPPPEEQQQVQPQPQQSVQRSGTSTPVDHQQKHDTTSVAPSVSDVAVETEPTLAIVQEVQIELIETRAFVNSGEGDADKQMVEQLELVITTPTIKVQEPAGASDGEAVIESKEMQTETEQTDIELAQMRDSEMIIPEELSPTTDEYQEGLQFGADGKDVVYDYDIVDTDRHLGYIPPAPTPAPSMAPLAELDVDTVDDEPCESATSVVIVASSSHEEVRKKRKKRNSDGRKIGSLDDKDKDKDKDKEKEKEKESKASTSTGGGTDPEHNAVCPWEDENVTTTDGTFVKTYATLGYL
ncbi:uncharacterized protein Dwil_GK10200 [Drosophila willistoni]|uniref:Regulator of G-protein signaling 7 n=1 Tax=Drosophila willistoni TaxID=7260 RepID=B4NDB4_DROWI|nr:uncharacterized protein LOC6648760 isoform X1 [Drosophila willistoni]XP_046867410.1 uncharacterized protein LOC6648760 isoform X1 [Drosophila willistoni]EDW82823.2 uncharacterized protein Dwil_GK10200 [Drosophila willistoni]